MSGRLSLTSCGIAAMLLLSAPARADAPVVRVGSKAFTEGVILGEVCCHLVREAGGVAVHRDWLGDTAKVWNGLLNGNLDVYCEYTGTLLKDILDDDRLSSEEQLPDALARRGLRMSKPLGFNNTYALGMRADRAAALGIKTISDLKKHPKLKIGLSNPFLQRDDGWYGVKARYGLPFEDPRGLDHALVYKALENGTLDVTDLYSTDAQIVPYHLVLLEDDLHFFPDYQAVLVYRADLETRAPAVVKSLKRLEGAFTDDAMRQLNSRVEVDDMHETLAAAEFLNNRLQLSIVAQVPTFGQELLARTWEHLLLVAVSLGLAVAVALPLGVLSARIRWLGQVILAVVGIIQTIPALALLFMVSVMLHMLGVVPAIVALFCYSLLPIVRNTHTGLSDIPLPLRESAEALGLSGWARLRLIELPLAARAILAGIKTSAVINIGNATLGGLIAAGGYGRPIIIGLNKNNLGMILQGAIPAVLMALLAHVLFECIERLVVSRGLRLQAAR